MALNYLLDTNTLSEPVRRKPNLQVLARLQRSGEQIAVAVIRIPTVCQLRQVYA